MKNIVIVVSFKALGRVWVSVYEMNAWALYACVILHAELFVCNLHVEFCWIGIIRAGLYS